jgi:hypothetical protein
MRPIRLEHDGDWLVLVITGTRIKRVYFRREEAALVVALLNRELGEVTTRKIGIKTARYHDT